MKIFLKYKVHLFLFLLTLISINYLFPNYFYRYLVPVVVNKNQVVIFADWSVIISAINCKLLGYNVFINNPCDFMGRPHVYGSALLFIPFFKEFTKIYIYNFPIIINLGFLIFTLYHFKFLKLKEIFLFIFFIFNPATLLAMERLNIDLFILMFVMFICSTRLNFLKIIIITIISSIKFYPLLLVQIFFLDKKKLLKSILLFLITIILFSIAIFLDKNNIGEILNNSYQFMAQDRYLFSIFSIQDYLKIDSYFFNIVIFVLFIILTFFIFKFINKNTIPLIFDIDEEKHYNAKLMLVGCSILCVTFFIFKNIYYREIFLFCALPYIVSQSHKFKIYDYFIYFIIFRYLFFLLSNGLSINQKINDLIVYKFVFDLFLIAILVAIMIFEYKYVYLSINKKK